ncbi:MAG: hypothetical protein ACRC46_10910 [Thermoguttaceae bacterium]
MTHTPPPPPVPNCGAVSDSDKPPVITARRDVTSILEDSGVFRAAIPPLAPSHVVRPPKNESPEDAGQVDDSLVASLRTMFIEPRFHIPLAGVALLTLMTGVIVGVWFASVTRPDRRDAAGVTTNVAENGAISFWGRLATSPPDVRGDANARVILIPNRAYPGSPMRASEANEPFTQIIELGGIATRTKSDGTFTLEIPAPQSYLMLAISAGSERDANAAIEASDINTLRQYFHAPEEVIGKSRFYLKTIDINAKTPPFIHVF